MAGGGQLIVDFDVENVSFCRGNPDLPSCIGGSLNVQIAGYVLHACTAFVLVSG